MAVNPAEQAGKMATDADSGVPLPPHVTSEPEVDGASTGATAALCSGGGGPVSRERAVREQSAPNVEDVPSGTVSPLHGPVDSADLADRAGWMGMGIGPLGMLQ